MQKTQLKERLRPIVESILKEGETVPFNATFGVTRGFRDMRKMMEILDRTIDSNPKPDDFWKTYDLVIDGLRKKIEQIDLIAQKSK